MAKATAKPAMKTKDIIIETPETKSLLPKMGETIA
jgi:hypothetical protein